jgi:hypothetical protein
MAKQSEAQAMLSKVSRLDIVCLDRKINNAFPKSSVNGTSRAKRCCSKTGVFER